MKNLFCRAILALLCSVTAISVQAENKWITVASTTSTVNSGLFDYLLPEFTATNGIEVRVLALGTGQAIVAARRGDADVLLVHHKTSEEQFVAEGFGVERFDVMYNDFVFIGPADDPAAVSDSASVSDIMRRVAKHEAPFVSRGDYSGTHKKELALWKEAGLDPGNFDSEWYREAGAGMGATLNMASAMQAYILSDRATWLNFGNKGDLQIL
ncbi:MAG: substrate-binding domain-containing protein, partial [Pseudomonadota bacterium]|nr:substrate-binding domain-containing protein [Pseudomonadota bacterium]